MYAKKTLQKAIYIYKTLNLPPISNLSAFSDISVMQMGAQTHMHAWIFLYTRDKSMPSCFSCVHLFATLWAVTLRAPLSMGFSRQENWSGLLCPPPGDLPNPGIKPLSLMSPLHRQVSPLPSAPPEKSINVVTQFRFWNLFNQFTTGMDSFLFLSVLKYTTVFKVCLVYNCTSVSQLKSSSANGHFDHSVLCW